MSDAPRSAPLIDWLIEHDLLRGPFVFADYWASVLGLGQGSEAPKNPLTDDRLFRVGLDRPDLELPRRRFYFLLYLFGPLLLPFRRLRRLGRYRVRFRRDVGESVMEALEPYRLELIRKGRGRVDVRTRPTRGPRPADGGDDPADAEAPPQTEGETLAADLIDPRVVAGFTSLFLATYKMAVASLIAILAVAVAGPWLITTGRVDALLPYWIPVGFPVVGLLLALLFRDWLTGVLGALPIVFGRYLLGLVSEDGGWLPFTAALVGLYLLYLVVDWLFVPRPVPPVLMLYRSHDHGYGRSGDAPYWLDGGTYWVWRYLMLSPAELNKFWERDWERIEVWVRADGPDAGALEWVVTDFHYRELWIPYERMGTVERLARQRERGLAHAREGDPGLWLVEMDAHPIFHTPYIRTVSFIPEREEVHVQSLRHLVNSLFSRRPGDDPDDYLPALDRLRMETGKEVLGDLPELIAPLVARQLLATPWRYWRYPWGAQRQRRPHMYDAYEAERPPPAADPSMQIKIEPAAESR